MWLEPEPSIWPGSGSSSNFSLKIHPNCMVHYYIISLLGINFILSQLISVSGAMGHATDSVSLTAIVLVF